MLQILLFSYRQVYHLSETFQELGSSLDYGGVSKRLDRSPPLPGVPPLPRSEGGGWHVARVAWWRWPTNREDCGQQQDSITLPHASHNTATNNKITYN